MRASSPGLSRTVSYTTSGWRVDPWQRRKKAARNPGDAVLEAAGVPGRPADYKSAAVIFAQGEPGTTVMFIKKGTVKLSVVSSAGRSGRRLAEGRRLPGRGLPGRSTSAHGHGHGAGADDHAGHGNTK